MKQYCRYCGYLVTGNGIWCRRQEREVSEAAAKSTNRCHDFAYNPIDAFGENKKGYIPRAPREKKKKSELQGQIEMQFD